MSDEISPSGSQSSMGPSADDLPNDLPPVQPPSIGFIFQLFVVPALIVLVVVGLWALFGRMAASEQDWQKLVSDLQSTNPQIRDRSMHGLAQMLNADLLLGGSGQGLAKNPQFVEALTNRLKVELASKSPDSQSASVYLCRALGSLRIPETTLPVLCDAMNPKFDEEIRKSAAASLALVGDHAETQLLSVDPQSRPLIDRAVETLIDFSNESQASQRRIGAFALGLYSTEAAVQRLEVLLGDADRDTAINAAIGLARQHHPQGWTVFEGILKDAELANSAEKSKEEIVEGLNILNNTLKAVKLLAKDLTAEQRATALQLIEPISQKHREIRIRIEAKEATNALAESRKAEK